MTATEALTVEAERRASDVGQQGGHDERESERDGTDPAAHLGQRRRLDLGPVVGPRCRVAHRSTPAADPLAGLGEQQREIADAAEREGHPAHAVGCHRRRHGVERQQGQAGKGGAAHRHGERVDGESDQADARRDEELDAGGHRDRCGIAGDVGAPGVEQLLQVLEGRAVGDHPEVGLVARVERHEVDEQRRCAGHRHERTRRRHTPSHLGTADRRQHGEHGREEPGAGEEGAAEADGRQDRRDRCADRQAGRVESRVHGLGTALLRGVHRPEGGRSRWAFRGDRHRVVLGAVPVSSASCWRLPASGQTSAIVSPECALTTRQPDARSRAAAPS